MADNCFCFFIRKPDLLKIERTKEFINEFRSKGQLVADTFYFKEEDDLVNVLFKNPDKQFVKILKDQLDIDLSPCFENNCH